MDRKLTVRVVEFSDRSCYQLQWNDPNSGRKKTKSSGIERTGKKAAYDAAMKVAGDWEKKLRSGESSDASRVSWQAFRERYSREVLPGLALRTRGRIESVLDTFEAIVNPKRLRDVTAERLSYFQSELRNTRKLAESTIKSMLAHVMAALRWGGRINLLAKVPGVELPKRAGGDKMKGRPITGEEFDRMVSKVEAGLILAHDGRKKPGEAGEKPKRYSQTASEADKKRQAERAADVAPSWAHFLRGLWLSGLRITESLDLWWDRDDKLCIDFSGKRPMLRIPASLEKGNKDRLLAITPDFAEFLGETPEAERHGPVFKPQTRRAGLGRPTSSRASYVISKIGEAAGVKAGTKRGGGSRFASAHDLRRSFGERWAMRVMPQVLMELMRHEDISTTMKYYVGRNAERTADVVWAAHEKISNSSGNKGRREATAGGIEEDSNIGRD